MDVFSEFFIEKTGLLFVFTVYFEVFNDTLSSK